MKIFVSCKQTGVPDDELNKDLLYIQDIIKQSGSEVYIYFFDKERKLDSKYIVSKVKKEIQKSDLVIGFIKYCQKSEGQLIELGIGEGMNE